MNLDEYNVLTKRLKAQLDQRGTLIKFHIPEAPECALRYNALFSGLTRFQGIAPIELVVEWSIKIEEKELRGFNLFTVDIILCSTEVIEYILYCTIMSITKAILHPEEISIIPSTSPGTF